MGNTPCAHAVDSVLHQRVEIKAKSGHSPKIVSYTELQILETEQSHS